MTGIKLFVDDLRECPEGWHLARTITEAIRILATMPVDEVSLDHDIVGYLPNGAESFSLETFKPVAYYIALMNPKPKVRIHTANVHEGYNMASILDLTDYFGQMYNPKDYQ